MSGRRNVGCLDIAGTFLLVCAVLNLLRGAFHLAVWYPIPVLALALLIVISSVRSNVAFRRRGYRVGPDGRDSVYYKEWTGSGERKLVLYGEMLRDYQIVEVPNDDRWDQKMPAWAKGRKSEIMQRVREHLGTKYYSFEEK